MPSVGIGEVEGVEVRRMQLRPGDTIVLMMDETKYQGSIEDLIADATATWPANRIAILTNGIEIAVVSPVP